MAAEPATVRSKAPTRRREAAKATALADAEKDDIELRLEKTLFGDEAGFLDSLTAQRYDDGRALQRARSASGEISPAEAEDKNLADVPDEDLFFLDAGTGELPPAVVKELQGGIKAEPQDSRIPVWYDSDDDRLTVSLASDTRLRKLRDTQDEDIITGREYILRLRRQYERLHPTPEWLTYAREKIKVANRVQMSGPDSDSDVSMDDDDDSIPSVQPLSELLRSAGSLTRSETSSSKSSRKLRPEVIDIQRTKDVVTSNPSSIDTLQFHPHYPLLLTAGPSSTVSLYHISPQPPNPNPILTSLHITKTPLHTAAFCTPLSSPDTTTDETRIFLSSRRRYFHTWSLSTGTITKVSRALSSFRHDQHTTESFKLSPCGRYMGLVSSSRKGGGSINVLSTDSMQWQCSCRVDSAGGIADFAWWSDGSGFCVAGKNGEVSEYSIPERRITCRWWDEGAVGTTVIATGGTNTRWVALGSSSGIVNIYDRHTKPFSSILTDDLPNSSSLDSIVPPEKTNRPSPTKTLSHLTTPISHLNFSPDAQILVISSRWKKNALRLVHLPSCTVYRNWPTEKTALGRISAVAFSAGNGGGQGTAGAGAGGGGWLAVASEAGRVGLWEIRA